MRHCGVLKGWLFSVLLALSWPSLAAVAQEGTLVVALDTLGGQSMDPIQETRSAAAHYQAPMFDSLVGVNYEKGGGGAGCC